MAKALDFSLYYSFFKKHSWHTTTTFACKNQDALSLASISNP